MATWPMFRTPGRPHNQSHQPAAQDGQLQENPRRHVMKKIAVRVTAIAGGIVALLLAGGASMTFR